MPSTTGIVASSAAAFTSPLTDLSWYSAYWASDPLWQNEAGFADGASVAFWRPTGSWALASETRIVPGLGMFVPNKQSWYARVVYESRMNITGDLDVRIKAKLDDWTPSSPARGLMEKRNRNQDTADLAWDFAVNPAGTIQLAFIAQGNPVPYVMVSSAATGFTDGTSNWVRFVFDSTDPTVSNNSSVTFYTSSDGTNWTQLGTKQNVGAFTTITSNTSDFSIGCAPSDNADDLQYGVGGYIERAIVKDGIDGTSQIDADFTAVTTASNKITDSTGAVIYIRSNADLHQTTTAKRPTYKTSVTALNNRPAVRGDGSNDWLRTQLFPSTIAQPWTVVLIAANHATGKLLGNAALTSNRWFWYWNGTNVYSVNTGGSTVNTANNVANANGHLFVFRANGASSLMQIDGTSVSTGNSGTGAAEALSLYDLSSAAGFASPADIAFAGIYAGDVTADANWAAFKTWAASYYGLTIV